MELRDIQLMIDAAGLSIEDSEKLHKWLGMRINQANRMQQQREEMSLIELLEMYVGRYGMVMSDSTVEAYRDAIFVLEEMLQRTPNLNDLEADTIALFMARVKGELASAKARSLRLEAMRGLARFAADQGLIESQQAEPILSTRFARAVA